MGCQWQSFNSFMDTTSVWSVIIAVRVQATDKKTYQSFPLSYKNRESDCGWLSVSHTHIFLVVDYFGMLLRSTGYATFSVKCGFCMISIPSKLPPTLYIDFEQRLIHRSLAKIFSYRFYFQSQSWEEDTSQLSSFLSLYDTEYCLSNKKKRIILLRSIPMLCSLGRN